MEIEEIKYLRQFTSERIAVRCEVSKLDNFLKSQYIYETGRNPTHPIFKEKYKLPYYDLKAMFKYYMNPLDGMKYEYYATDDDNSPWNIILCKIARARAENVC